MTIELSCGLPPGPAFNDLAMLMPATVMEPEEDRDSARVRDAVGPWKVVSYHETYAIAGPDAVDALPGGREWRNALEMLAPEEQRHLLTYEGHVTALTERDHRLLDHAPDGLAAIGTPDEIAADVLLRRCQIGMQEFVTPTESPVDTGPVAQDDRPRCSTAYYGCF